MAKTNAVLTGLTSQSLAAGATIRVAFDLRAVDGGLLTFQVTNGGSGPTTPCEARVLVAFNTGSTPTSGAAGTDWKTITRISGGVAASAVTPGSFAFGPEVQHAEIEFTGHTGSAVTIEAAGGTYVF